MAKNKLIFDTRDLENASQDILNKVDRALVAAAFSIRDAMREAFIKSQSDYKYSTNDYQKLSKGIMVGKLKNSQVKIHSLGSGQDYDTYKTRFFVGGTTYRKNSRGNKGFIKSNTAVDKGLQNAENILNTYIKNTLDN